MEKNFELMQDKNGRTMRTGDIVKIENAYFKNDNGYYFIDRAPGDASWSGSDYSLKKIGKRGKISTAKYNLASWPLCSYCADQRKNWAADEHNKDNATIEIVDCIDNTEVIAHFKEEVEKAREQAHYYEMRGYDWEKWVKVYSDTADHYEKVIERMTAGNNSQEENMQNTEKAIKNLSQFKKAVSNGLIFQIVKHGIHEECTGQIRKVNVAQTNAFYSVEYNKPDSKVSRWNDGKGSFMLYGKAKMWDFSGDTIKVYRTEERKDLIFEIEILTEEEADSIMQEEGETEAAETALTGEAKEVHAEAAETAGNGTDEPQERYFVVRILCADGTHTETVKALTPEEAKRKVEIKPHEHYGSVSFAEESELFATNPSPVSKSYTEETPEENSGTPSGDSKNYTAGSDNTEGKSDTPSGDEKSYATKTAVKYYEISEDIARLAHEMISFRDYKKNSTTDEYRASVDRAAEIAEKQKRKVSPYYHAKIDALLDKYARRLAEWTNAYNRNQASCPSVMICGPANFPTRKKQKQNSREDTLWKEYKDIKGIIGKIKSVGTGAIDLADPHARELLQERLDNLKGQLELDKKLNAYWKKHKTFIGYPDISADFAEKLTKETNDMFERYTWMSKPFPDYNLASIRDKIKRTAARLEELNRRQEAQSSGDNANEKFDGGEIVRNYEQNRLQILFNEKPDEETRQNLKSHGFRWSPRNSAWQRQLTANAEHAARQALKLA